MSRGIKVNSNTQKQQAQASPYLAFYGLAREPFAASIEFDLFYAEPTRVQRLDILHHLTQYNDALLLVTGPEGSGKSTLLQQYIAKASETWEVVRVEASGGIDERNLVQQIYHQLELNFRGATHPELLEQLEHHLDGLLHSARQGVLLVDDAHLLTTTALQRVLQLASLRNFTNKPLLRVILFGESSLEEKLDDPLLAQFAGIPHRIIDLPPFDEEHSTHYLLHRLSAARFVAGEPFTEAALHTLHKQSQGWPGRLNSLAHQLLLDSLPSSERPSELPGISDRDLYKPKRLIGVSLVIVILLIFIVWDIIDGLFDASTDAETTTVDMSADKPTAPPATSERSQQALAIPAQKSDNAPISPPRPASLDEAIASIIKDAAREQTPNPQPQEKPAPEKTASHETASPAAETLPPAKAETTQTPPAKTAPVASKPAADTPLAKQWQALPDWLPARGNEWLLSRDPQHFTLQLIAGERLDTLRKFIIRHKLKQHLAFYQTQRNNKPWYTLVYGEYVDKQRATNARNRLPQALRKQKPWIRRFDGIQQTLK
ncbi:MAG TPA: AAA family ATPase [Gammaproteobacteria bacterium]|nr:AAA family ATPase [Gammaproteobacteria bacterium]